MNAKQELVRALSWCGLNYIPQEDTGDTIWLRAIALVSKNDGSKNYAVYERGYDGKPRCIKDFGSVCQIVKIDKLFPFFVLDKSNIPNFKGKFKEERIAWLRANGVNVTADDATTKELDTMILNLVAYMELRKTKIRR